MSLLPVRMNKIQTKVKVLGCSSILHSFFKRSEAAYSIVGDGIWQKFKLIHAFIVVLVTCKSDEDSSQTEALDCSQHFSQYKYMEIFSDVQGQLTP